MTSRRSVPRTAAEGIAAPVSYARLLWLIVEGYIYLALIVGVFLGAVAFLLWGVLTRRPSIGLLAVMIGAPLVLTTGRAIRALCVVFPEPRGVPVSPAFAGTLYAAVEDIRTRIGAPRLHKLLVTGACNASAFRRPRFGPLWARHTLLIGYPLLATLAPEQVRAVIAHELGHITHAHGRFTGWVHRTRVSWVSLMRALDRYGATPLFAHLLFRWYVPRLDAGAAAVSRRQELLADRMAADVTGAQTAAQALVAIEIGGQLLDRTFWPRVFDRVRTDPDPPRPYSEMGPAIWARLDDPASLLAQVLEAETPGYATHPSLRERLAALDQPAQIPPASAFTAADHFLRDDQQQVAAALDEEWQSREADWWNREHRGLRDRQKRLSQLAGIPSPSPEQTFERAELTEQEGHEEEAMELYISAHARGHALAGLGAGRLLLRRDDPAGMALIEEAMAADPALVENGCGAIAEFLEGQNRFTDAHPYRVRQGRHATQNRMAAAERTEVTPTDRFSPGWHPQVDIAELGRRLAAHPTALRAWLAAKELRYSPGRQTVLAVLTRGAPPEDLAAHLRRDCGLPDDVVLVVLGRHDRPLEAALESACATLIFTRSAV